MTSPDVIVVGGGIVGCACADELAARGRRVAVLESGTVSGGTTGAGQGHIAVLGGTDALFDLVQYSRTLWTDMAAEFSPEVEWEACGTLWLAENEEQMNLAGKLEAYYRARGIEAERIDGPALRRAEGELAPDLPGGMWVGGDAVLYQPGAAAWLADRVRSRGGTVETGVAVARVESGGVVLEDGSRRAAGAVVNAAGVRALDLFETPPAGASIRPRKGHLVVTERVPGFLNHHLTELGYLASAGGQDKTSFAFNLQRRATEQVILGSSRQYDRTSPAVEPEVVARLVERGARFLPRLEELRALRVWAGFRPASADGLPYLGPVPELDGVYLAAGHEGLGTTTAPGTARLIADLMLGEEPGIDPAPYRVARS